MNDTLRRLPLAAWLLLGACAVQAPPPAPAATLENTDWRLSELDEARGWRITGATLVLGGESGDLARFAASVR